MNTANTFGDRVKELRKKKGMTQEQLAETLYLENHVSISNYENNKRMPSAETVVMMAQVLGTTTDYLLNGTLNSNATVDQAHELLKCLTPEHQMLALEHIKLLVEMEQGFL